MKRAPHATPRIEHAPATVVPQEGSLREGAARAVLPRLVYHVLADRAVVFAVATDGTVKGHVVSRGRTEMEFVVARLRRRLSVDLGFRGLTVRGAPRGPAPRERRGHAEPLLRDLYRE